MAFALQARIVYPVDRPAILNGVVTIEGERIVSVGAKSDAAEVFDLGDVALLPGFVNCHTHLEFSDLARPLGLPGMPFVEWIRVVIAQRARSSDSSAGAVLRGLLESSRAGVTTIGEITQGHIEELTGGAARLPMLTLFCEVIGFSRARAESAFAATVDRIETLAERATSDVGLSPHAPYTVSPALYRKLIELANERSMTVATHLAESEEELRFLDSGSGAFQELLLERSMWDAEAIPRGSRPLDYLKMLARAPRALVIHGNYLDAEERAFLGAHANQMSVIYCPRTHAYFQHPPYPLRELLECGARVALGTDSRASNPDLSVLSEMKHVAAAFPTIGPHAVLHMGTLAGAEALGYASEAGSLTPGKLANVVAMPVSQHAIADADDALAGILASDAAPSRVWFRGREIDA